MSIRRAALAAASALAMAPFALPQPASADPLQGLYIAGGGGLNLMERSTVEPGANAFLPNRGKANFDLGWVALGSVGWGFGNGIRLEVEGFYRQNDLDKLSGFGTVAGSLNSFGGDQRTYGAMVNAFYDLDFSLVGLNFLNQFGPYVGAGAGYAWTEYDGVRANVGATPVRIDDTAGQFAYQGIFGMNFPIEPVPGLALTAEYRYMGTLDTELSGSIGGTSTKFDVSNSHHSVLLGARYAFNATRPPPPAAAAPTPAPQSARTYLVFFDFDRADLTDRARAVVAEAAASARGGVPTRLEVSGHADRSGSPAYNQRLSERRAESVANELVARGVPRNDISVQAFGESRPLVATADNVREPQNRRVEIVLR